MPVMHPLLREGMGSTIVYVGREDRWQSAPRGAEPHAWPTLTRRNGSGWEELVVFVLIPEAEPHFGDLSACYVIHPDVVLMEGFVSPDHS